MEQFDFTRMTRRSFVKAASIAGAALGATAATGIQLMRPPKKARAATQLVTPNSQGQMPLLSSTIPQFAHRLPVLSITQLTNGTIDTIVAPPSVELQMREFKANMLPPGAVAGYDGTYVWGYVQPGTDLSTPRDTFTGPVIVAKRNVPMTIKYVNNLPATVGASNVMAYKYAIDQSLHWAAPGGMMRYVPGATADSPWLGNPNHYAGSIPSAAHLHGAEDPAAVDGGPDSWFTSDGAMVGQGFYSEGWDGKTPQNYCVYTYPNTQEAAPTWFHDHTLGATRLNVYCGLAGAYMLIDPGLVLPTGLTVTGLADVGTDGVFADSYDDVLIPLVIQDRIFDTTGQLYFPSGPDDPLNPSLNPEHQFWAPEFFDSNNAGLPTQHTAITVNGKVWPFYNIPPEIQRFYLIEGSNARSYVLSFKDSLPDIAPGYNAGTINPSPLPTIWQISTDQGYLDDAVQVDYLRVMPGERIEFLIDFRGCENQNYVLNNFGPDVPVNIFPMDPADNNDPATTGTVMQFVVGPAGVGTKTAHFDPSLSALIRQEGQKIVRLVDPVAGTLAGGVTVNKTRALTLNEIAHDSARTVNGYNFGGGPLEILVNNSHWMGTRPNEAKPNDMMGLPPINGGTPDGLGNFITELPREGTTEIWEIVNTTMDAHPIHTHLAQFQLMNRQAFNLGDIGAPVAGTYAEAYWSAFPGGAFIPAYGPPLAYNPTDAGYNAALQGGKWGGNPDPAPFLNGNPVPPDAFERGWKDTVMAPPGVVTRFVIRWGPQDIPVSTPAASIQYPFVPNGPTQAKGVSAIYDYVWHCHIVDHEDNEMMRPDAVYAPPVVTIKNAIIPKDTDTLTGDGSFRASGAPKWVASIDFGDGSGPQPLALNGLNFSFTHEYADVARSYDVTVTVTDGLGISGSDTKTVSVTAMTVAIDFNPTTFNPNANGTFKVTINGSAGFNVNSVDQSTLRFGPVAFTGGVRPSKVQIAGGKMMVFFDRPAGLIAGTTKAYLWGETTADVLFVGSSAVTVLSR